jgi:hypothetical protein
MTTINSVSVGLAGSTGTGTFVGSTSPTLVSPALGTPTSGVATNLTITGGLRSFQMFTSGTAQTYTKPANVSSILIEVVGGGGGGGGAAVSPGDLGAGSGGDAGGYARLYVASAASTYTYTVGSGGAGGASGANNGSPGGTTSFSASSLSASGGSSGFGGSPIAVPFTGMTRGAAQSPGTGSNGDINIQGGAGFPGIGLANSFFGGAGGNSQYGQGGITATSDQSFNATGYGAGGSGGSGNASNQPGGNGSGGLIIVWEFS